MEELIEIPVKVYKELLDDQFMLECLQAGGVDNWEGYDFSMEEYWNAKEESE